MQLDKSTTRNLFFFIKYITEMTFCSVEMSVKDWTNCAKKESIINQQLIPVTNKINGYVTEVKRKQ